MIGGNGLFTPFPVATGLQTGAQKDNYKIALQ